MYDEISTSVIQDDHFIEVNLKVIIIFTHGWLTKNRRLFIISYVDILVFNISG